MRLIFVSLFLLVISNIYHSASAADYQSPRIAALGGAGSAGPLLNDAIYLNPSYISLLKTYGLGLNYLKFHGTDVGDEPKGRNFSASVQDGKTELFQAGAAYTKREDGVLVQVGASSKVSEQVSLGIAGKLYLNDQTRTNGKDGAFSLTYLVNQNLQFAVIGDQLFESTASKARGLYRQATVGVKYNLEKLLLLYADPHYAPKGTTGRYGYNVGAEIVVMNDFFLRAGYFRNSYVPQTLTNERGYGAGAGWMGPKISFDYGFQRVLSNTALVTHSFGTTVFF
jgi:hypothetical protein